MNIYQKKVNSATSNWVKNRKTIYDMYGYPLFKPISYYRDRKRTRKIIKEFNLRPRK